MHDSQKKPPVIRLSLQNDQERRKDYPNNNGLTLDRVSAFLIDCFILIAITATLFFITFGLASPIISILFPIIPILYFATLLVRPEQATFGQKILKIRVISGTNDGKITWPQALIQVIILYMIFSMTAGLALLWAFIDSKHRCPHEILTDTYVIRTKPK